MHFLRIEEDPNVDAISAMDTIFFTEQERRVIESGDLSTWNNQWLVRAARLMAWFYYHGHELSGDQTRWISANAEDFVTRGSL